MDRALMHGERALQHAWTTVTRAPSYVAQIQIRDDTKVALVVGLVLGVVIIVLLAKFPGEPFDYSTTEEEPSKEEQVASAEPLVGDVTTISGSDAQSVDDILKDEDRLLANQRLGRATKMLGLTDGQVRLAIRQARSELRSGKTGTAAAEYEYGSLSAKVDVVFYVLAFGALFYFLNRDYGGLATEWVRQAFPREADLLFGPRSDL